jgi:hypothetical protein
VPLEDLREPNPHPDLPAFWVAEHAAQGWSVLSTTMIPAISVPPSIWQLNMGSHRTGAMKYDPRVTYNVNVYRRHGKVHLNGCWQGDLHRAAKPTHYAPMRGNDIPPHKERCRFCLPTRA